MTDKTTSQRTPLMQAYLVIQQLKEQLKTAEAGHEEPIAIIGLGCRFPSAPDPEAFWDLLQNGVDATREVPKERWDVDAYYDPSSETPGKTNVRRGAFLDNETIPSGIESFDADFFHISPREAVSLDPHQRILLEVGWEAIESAGITANQLRNSNTGVYIGHDRLNSEYTLLEPSCLEEDRYIESGAGVSFPAGRLSYFLGLQGPSLVVSTACSSSMVSTCLAIQALRSGECDLALAGGVQLYLSPESTVLLSKINALAPDGRCKAFDATADGYGRGEGCGVIVLKRLSQAIEDGDNIRAVIRGSAVNHDGPSAGLTVPSGQAQEKLLKQALKSANVEPDQIDYIEAHGTGTALGDPIEVRAIDKVMGTKERATPLFIGSVKTNIGHLEAASGIAGLIKVILSLENEKIPPSLHFNNPNPNIQWDKLPIKVATQCMPWPNVASGNSDGTKKRLAGVSSFGFSGTNSHVILEQAPSDENKQSSVANNPTAKKTIELLTLSAKSKEALTALASRYVQYFDTTPSDLTDICFTANRGRTDFPYRLSLVGTEKDEMRQKLARFVSGDQANGLFSQQITNTKVAFLFTGQGSQYAGMGQSLYENEPMFRQIIERCDTYLRQFDVPLLSLLYSAEEPSLLNQTAYTQPALFAIEYALAQVWRSWGIKPSVVMGHSVGEYVAACVAEVFSLEDGLKLMVARGRLMGALPQDGEMISFLASETKMQQAIEPYQNEVSIAAVNGPQSIVISGKHLAVTAIAETLATEGIQSRQLTVSHAFHSPLMNPMLDEFRQVAESITYSKPKLQLVSNVNGKVTSNEIATANYWVDHVHKAVRFSDGVKTLHEQGVNLFLEVGPQATLLGMARLAAGEKSTNLERDIAYLPSLREGQNDWQQMLTTVSELYVRGVEINWTKFYAEHNRRKVLLPTYPFQRQRYWISDAKQASADAVPSIKSSASTSSHTDTSLIGHLQAGNISALVALLEDKLSPDERDVLPTILENLAEEQQQQAAQTTIRDWLYEVEWQPQSLTQTRPKITPSMAQTWLILADTAGVSEVLSQQLSEQGIQPVLVTAGEMYRQVTSVHIEINPQQSEDYQRLLNDLPQVEHIVHLWSLDTPHCQTADKLMAAAQQSCGTTLHLMRALAKAQRSLTNLYLVTRDTQAVHKRDQMTGITHAMLWGIGRVIAIEDPSLNCVCIDLEGTTQHTTDAESAYLVGEILAATPSAKETQVAFRQGIRHVARLIRSTLPEPKSQSISIQDDVTYLITGGLGGLGLLVADWLVEQGARHLLLMGRSQPKAAIQQKINKWVELDVTVTVEQVDVSDLAQLTTMLANVNPSYPLQGIIHAAGVSEDACLFPQVDKERFSRALAAKFLGTWQLHKASEKMALDFFVSFSSVSSLLGEPGLGDYAAANAFLDAFAQYQNRQGTKSLSVNWGAWADVGMGADLENQAEFKRTGYTLIPPKLAFKALSRLLQQDAIQVGVAPIEWSKFLKHPARKIAFFSAFSESCPTPAVIPKTPTEDGIKYRLQAVTPRKQRQLIQSYLGEKVAMVLGSTQLPDATRGFNELGMDSLMTLELRQHLADDLQIKLPTTLTFEYPSITTLGDYLLQKLFETKTDKSDSQQLTPPISIVTNNNVATKNTDMKLESDTDASKLEDELSALENLLRT